MTQRPRVLLLVPHLGGGGATQVITLLARCLSREKYDLHLGLITKDDDESANLPTWVQIHSLNASRVRTSAFRMLRLVWRLKPDLILSSMAHLNFLVLLLRPFYPQKTAVLVRQNGTVSAALAFGGFARYTRLLYRRLYPRADWVICQTGAMAQDLVAELGIREDRLAVLPNPVEVDEIRRATDCSESQWTGPGPHLLAVGRVSREKGFDLLLRAFASVLEHFPNADLVIAGKGPEEAPLKAQCRQLGLDASVCISGHVPHPSVYFPGATLFVLSSRHEGLPNALLEAAAAGLPIVALPASGGVVDLLRGQPATWLAANISAGALATSLLAALETLLPVERFDHAFVEQFSIERAIPAYQQLIDATLKEAQP